MEKPGKQKAGQSLLHASTQAQETTETLFVRNRRRSCCFWQIMVAQ
jgi:hypothetical protein